MPTDETQEATPSLIKEVTAKIILGGKDYEIKKLKAGKFYEAQRIFAEILKTVQIGGENAKKVPAGQDGEVTDLAVVNLDQVVKILADVPTQVAKFVAFCAELEESNVLEIAYPEEINEAFGVCLKLNNVVENLKNFAAPMEKLGAAS